MGRLSTLWGSIKYKRKDTPAPLQAKPRDLVPQASREDTSSKSDLPQSLPTSYGDIHRLPPEVLAYIFELEMWTDAPPTFVPALAFRSSPYRLVRLTHVCRAWRNTSLVFPELWASIDDTERAGFQTYLARSKEARLRVYLHMDVEWSLPQLQSHFHRIQELHIDPQLIILDPSHILGLLQQPAPALQSFSIRGCHSTPTAPSGIPTPSEEPCLSFDGFCPLLRRVTCEPSHIGALTGLTHLCVTGALSVHASPASAHSFFACIRENRCLQVIVLTHKLVSSRSTQDGPLHHSVDLPDLHTIALGLMRPQEMAFILSCMVLPSTASITAWDVWWDYHDDEVTDLGTVFPGDLSGLPGLAEVDRLRCTQIEDDELQLTATTPRGAVIDIRGPVVHRSDRSWDALHASYMRTLSRLPAIFVAQGVQELWIGASPTPDTEDEPAMWFSMLLPFRELRRLTLVHLRSAQTIIPVLCTGHKFPDLSLSCLFLPRLCDLRLVHTDTTTAILVPLRAARTASRLPVPRVEFVHRHMPLDTSDQMRHAHYVSAEESHAYVGAVPVFKRPPGYLSTEQEKALAG